MKLLKIILIAACIYLIASALIVLDTKWNKPAYGYENHIVITDDQFQVREDTVDKINAVFETDGSIHWLKSVVKRNLTYPEYFKHVKTQYEQLNTSSVRVWMYFDTRYRVGNIIRADVKLTGKTPLPEDISNIVFINVSKTDYK